MIRSREVTPVISLGASAPIGGDPNSLPPASVGFDMKRDILAGALAFSAPFAYDKWAPKKWPHPGIISTVAVVIGTYFATVWTYEKLRSV